LTATTRAYRSDRFISSDVIDTITDQNFWAVRRRSEHLEFK
jgi:hypothetical protein